MDPSDDADDWEIPDFGVGTAVDADEPGSTKMPTSSVSNPPGTVTATASIDGRVQRVELAAASKAVASMTERELAQEILLVGRLAGTKARADLYTWLMDRSDATGQDSVAAARLLRDDMGLPTPTEAAAAQAEAFSEHYGDGHG